MRFRHSVLPVALAFSAFPVIAQDLSQRDPRAVDVLTQAVGAAGGLGRVRDIQDFKASGTITYYWADEEVHGAVTMRGRGTRHFRLDAILPTGERSWAVSDGEGSLRDDKGNTTAIPYHNAVNLGSLTFPLVHLAFALEEHSLSVEYLGLTTRDDRATHHFRMRQLSGRGSEAEDHDIAKLTSREYFIDAITLQLVSSVDMVYPQRDPSNGHPREILFADYRSIDGVLVPFSITETVARQRTWTIQLNEISFNTGLQDIDFEVTKN
ncbi:MAG: DUF4292 domain-containing protein [Verrucomicrobiales bacterium]|nr:DUF4292 domain-containing protein [Verrucomicrobiales bacterium]